MRHAGLPRTAALTVSAVLLPVGAACAPSGAEAVGPRVTACAVSDTAGFSSGSTGAAVWAGVVPPPAGPRSAP